jgi:hypothetical protein
MDIPDDILSEAPVEIPMWHFDESTGLWDEQGMATKNGSEYTTELPHFSTWNCDIPNSAITISGRLINTEGSPIGSAHIAPYASDAGRGGLFNTNEDGTFSRRVPRGSLIDLFLAGRDCVNPYDGYLLSQVGGFQSDASLGDIVVSDGGTKSLAISGSFLDCNNQPITKGFLQILGHSYTLSSGPINLTTIFCDALPSEVTYRVFDRTTDRTAIGRVDVTSSKIDLGEVKTCLLEDEYFNVECAELNINTAFPIIEFDNQTDEVHIKVINGTEELHLGAYFSDETSPNTYTLHADKYVSTTGIFYEPIASQVGDITFTKQGDFYIGTFTSYLQRRGETTINTFTGSFKVFQP